QLLLKPACGQLVQLEQLAALAALMRFFGRGEFPFGQSDAALLGDEFNGFQEADILDLLHEGENVARFVTTKAMVELAHRMHRKRCRLFPVKGAKTLHGPSSG